MFLIIRCSILFEYATDILFYITVIGSTSAFFASTIGLAQNDLKKVIAYSTASQLGYMIFACGLSAYHVSFFHLINHAFFKALLFLGAGVIIHGLNDEQDMRRMGGLIKLFPYTYSCLLIGSLALGGFPFLSGFYSKDLILELSYSKFKLHGLFAFILGSVSAFLTAFYSGRLLLLTFGQTTNIFRYNTLKIHEGNFQLTLPLLLLIVGSLFSGFFLKDMFIGFGSIFFNNSIYTLYFNKTFFDVEFIPSWIKLIPTIFGLTGFSVVFVIYKSPLVTSLSKLSVRLYSFFNNKWYFDHIYNIYFGSFMFWLSYNICYKAIDKGILEFLGASNISNSVYRTSKLSVYFQTGIIYNYLSLLVFSWLLILFFFEITL